MRPLLPLALLAATLAFVAPATAAKVELSGQVTYAERVDLPDDATLRIELFDRTIPNAPPRFDVRGPIGHGQVPLSFTLSFEDALILPNHDYALVAEIGVPAGTMFRNIEPYSLNPLSPAEPVVIMTTPAVQPVAETSSDEPATPALPAILDTTWRLASIGGNPPAPRSNTTLLIGDDLRAGGSGGCNSWFAPAQLENDRLSFSSVTSTQKGCTQSINLQEKAFYDALAATASWQVSGDMLTLFDARGQALLTFSR